MRAKDMLLAISARIERSAGRHAFERQKRESNIQAGLMKDRIGVKVWGDSLWISFDGCPVMNVDDMKCTIVEAMHNVHTHIDDYANYKLQQGKTLYE